MIERLRTEINALSKSEQELNVGLQALNIQETEMNVLCDEFKASQDELHQTAAKNSTEMQTIRGQQNEVKGQIAVYEEMIEELDAEQEKIIAQAIAKAEAERKAKEEAEKKAKAEAERKAKEEADRKAREEAERKAAEEAQRQAAVTQAPVNQQKSETTVTTAKPVSPASTAAPVTTKAPVTTAAPTTTAAPQQNSSKLQWPAPGHYHISSSYGNRTLDGVTDFHGGIDISDGGINGTAACAAASGTVLMHGEKFCTHNFNKHYNCGCNGGYGNYLILDHGNGIYTLYAHLASISVADGQSVTVGQQVGVIGSTGHSTGPHLHFEVRVGGSGYGNRVNPQDYLP